MNTIVSPVSYRNRSPFSNRHSAWRAVLLVYGVVLLFTAILGAVSYPYSAAVVLIPIVVGTYGQIRVGSMRAASASNPRSGLHSKSGSVSLVLSPNIPHLRSGRWRVHDFLGVYPRHFRGQLDAIPSGSNEVCIEVVAGVMTTEAVF